MVSDSSTAYGFGNIVEDLNPANIYKRVPDAVLWRHYIGSSFQLHKSISAPYRKDSKPSFGLYYDKNDRIKFRDLGTSNGGDIIDYLKVAYNLGYVEAIRKLNCDFNLNLGTQQDGEFCQNGIVNKITKQEFKRLEKFQSEFVKKNASLVQVRLRKYEQQDLDYWMQFGVNLETLKLYKVYCVEKLFINKDLKYSYTPGNPGYAYHFLKSDHIKCYFPLSSSLRFVGNVNNYEDIQGYYQCRVKETYKNKILILTKSLKDCMVLHQFGIDAMAIHGEGQYFNEDFIRHIKKYYPRIVSLYDRDQTGVKGARVLWKEYRIPAYFIDKKLNEKDISDIYKVYGEKKVSEVLKKIIEGI